MKTTYKQSGSLLWDGGDQYTGLDLFGRVGLTSKDSSRADLERVEYGF